MQIDNVSVLCHGVLQGVVGQRLRYVKLLANGCPDSSRGGRGCLSDLLEKEYQSAEIVPFHG